MTSVILDAPSMPPTRSVNDVTMPITYVSENHRAARCEALVRAMIA